jgi:hypothetical protein
LLIAPHLLYAAKPATVATIAAIGIGLESPIFCRPAQRLAPIRKVLASGSSVRQHWQRND